MSRMWRVAGLSFEHMHMGDNLRMAFEHPQVEIVGVCDPDRDAMRGATEKFSLSDSQVFTDADACIEAARPDFVILCPATARHGEWTERAAAHGVHMLVEKPFAANLAEADRMIAAADRAGVRLAINWPLAWHASHRTAKRLVDEGTVGEVIEVHHYGGNRGPLWHLADKVETSPVFVAQEKSKSWFYQAAAGGGSLLDYLGYGTTLGTWFLGGRKPIEVTAVVDDHPGLEVDEHSITVARYAFGLSKFETRWGTFTDPWTLQPQPKCGFVIKGRDGTISSYDYAETVRVQTRSCPEGKDVAVDALVPPFQNPVQYFVHCLERELRIEGPLSVETARIGQQIVDTAAASAREKRTLPLLGEEGTPR
ncbi:MAG: Gfo/Idh/MocA family oxidoreductase [Candidatus Hydrogenedentes bacterium]|nr:Gfo/Idh/MocA family oxidoreductase [Candidatus Hydrogenedentota bacterium]